MQRERKRRFGVNAIISHFSLSASLSLFSALTLSSHAHLWSLKLSLKVKNDQKLKSRGPALNLSCFREFEERDWERLGRYLRCSDLKKFMVCDCLILAGRLFQTSGALLVNESMPGREEGQNGRSEFPLPLVR